LRNLLTITRNLGGVNEFGRIQLKTANQTQSPLPRTAIPPNKASLPGFALPSFLALRFALLPCPFEARILALRPVRTQRPNPIKPFIANEITI